MAKIEVTTFALAGTHLAVDLRGDGRFFRSRTTSRRNGFPFVTYGIIAINAVTFLFEVALGHRLDEIHPPRSPSCP
jgi:hypothetical protein